MSLLNLSTIPFWDWFQSGAAAQVPTNELQYYLSNATLPRMVVDSQSPLPPAGHKSHKNTLHIRPEPWRKLEGMERMDTAKLVAAVAQWTARLKMEKPFDGVSPDENGLKLSLPCDQNLAVSQPNFEVHPRNLLDIQYWNNIYPLSSVEKIMHFMYPEQSRGWRFDSDDPLLRVDLDFLGTKHGRPPCFGFSLWTYPLPHSDNVDPPADPSSSAIDADTPTPASEVSEDYLDMVGSKSVVVAYMPPWVLSEADIREFADVTAFPPSSRLGFFRPLKLTAARRTWAKIWDTCVRKRTRWFVLTSYDHWVFGRFSPNYTRAHVSQVFSHCTAGPTVFQLLAYWISSAMGLTENFPKSVVFEPFSDGVRLEIPMPDPTDIFPDVEEASESNWDGKSEAPGSSAGVQLSMAEVSLYSRSANNSPLDRPIDKTKMIADWIREIEGAPAAGKKAKEQAEKLRKVEEDKIAQMKAQGMAGPSTRKQEGGKLPEPLKPDPTRIGQVMWSSNS